MHGDYEQTDRENAIYRFRNSKNCFLVATDVASRGIDVDDVTHVYNYDMPTSKESFVHRVGRTGRAGRTGKAITLFGKREDNRKAIWLRDLLKSLNPEWTANPAKVSYSPVNLGQKRTDKLMDFPIRFIFKTISGAERIWYPHANGPKRGK